MTSMKLIVGNWKMNPKTLEDAKDIAQKARTAAAKLEHTEAVACPPFPFMAACASKGGSDSLKLGAQSASVYEAGAHTGGVSASMIASMGAEYAIAGHSEEREAGDTDETVSKRVARILEAGLTAIVCVGEKERDENGSHLEYLTKQIAGTFAGIPAEKVKRIVLAYEPVWAIGAKEAMRPEQIYEMSLFVKKAFSDLFGAEAGLKVKVLYGGSVNALNAAEIMTVGKVDGLLVGRESVNPSGFADLLAAVDAAQG